MTPREQAQLPAPQCPHLRRGNRSTYDWRVYSKDKTGEKVREALHLGHEGSTDGK